MKKFYANKKYFHNFASEIFYFLLDVRALYQRESIQQRFRRLKFCLVNLQHHHRPRAYFLMSLFDLLDLIVGDL